MSHALTKIVLGDRKTDRGHSLASKFIIRENLVIAVLFCSA